MKQGTGRSRRRSRPPVPCFPPKVCLETTTTVSKLELQHVVTPGPPFKTYLPIGAYGFFTQRAFKDAFKRSFDDTFGQFPQVTSDCEGKECACLETGDPIDTKSVTYTFVSSLGVYELRGDLDFLVEIRRGVCILNELEIKGKRVSQANTDWDKINEEALAARSSYIGEWIRKLS